MVKDGNSLFPSSHLKGHPSYDYEDARKIFVNLDNAFKHGLHFEFMTYFLNDYAENKNIDEAIFHANREWDL